MTGFKEYLLKTHPGLYSNGDLILRCSLLSTAYALQGDVTKGHLLMYRLEHECHLNTDHPIKSREYTWNKTEDVRKYIPCLAGKGAGINIDQARAYLTWLYVTKQPKKMQQVLRWFRFGVSPSLTELSVFKSYHLVLAYKTLDHWKLPAVERIYKARIDHNLKVPIHESTTDKITMLVTMHLMGWDMPPELYIRNVYKTYFHSETEWIGDEIVKGLIHG